jgi:iron complex outermembrane receptor protein
MGVPIRPLAAAIAVAFSGSVLAQGDTTALEPIRVTATRNTPLGGAAAMGSSEIAGKRAYVSDAAQLLNDLPGVSMVGAGGVSSLPAIRGLADDRLRITVDGMDFIASCPNHMNPPLSYLNPNSIGSLKVHAGVTPVSVGGDSIGGTIVAESKLPEFAAPAQGLLSKGELGSYYRSNNKAVGVNASATLASENFNINYNGGYARADNYTAGGDFKTIDSSGRPGHSLPRDEVGSTAYETKTHTLGFALKGTNHLLEARIGYQEVPEQLYPNQRMDMLNNEEKRINLRYLGKFDWGNLEASAYHQSVEHYMDFGQDKAYFYGTLSAPANARAGTYDVNGMPMYTKSRTTGFAVKSEIEATQRDLARFGWEYQTYRLDDWWPPAPDCGVGNCWGGMAPLTFENINNGQRDRNALFGELESRWNRAWSSLFGIRVEHVRTDSGAVHGYTDAASVPANFPKNYEGSSVGTRAAFNAMDRQRDDTNIDWTVLGRYLPDDNRFIEFGVARKTRSPNLYERYSWSTNSMAMEMVNFVGDGNGYVGNPNLRPEIAHTASVTADWHSKDREYQFVATPYYTYVHDYIDAVRRPSVVNMLGVSDNNATGSTQFVKLQYANQTARLYGIDVSGKMPLGKNSAGKWGARGVAGYVSGKNRDTGDNLYNIMPLNAKVALTHQLAAWESALEVIGVQSKTHVSTVRNEIHTPSYSLMNLRSSYTAGTVRFDFGIENLFDRLYYHPLGGAYVGQGTTMSFNAENGGMPRGTSLWGTGVPGMGRSIYAGINVRF